jgi:MFS family permease
MFVTFLPLHAGRIGLGPGRIGLIFAVQALVNVLSRLPFGRLGDTTKDRGLLAAAGFSLLAAGIAPMGFFTTIAAEAGCAAVIGIGMAIGFTTVGAILADSVQANLRGLAMGMYNSCIYFGMMMSAAVMGPFVRWAGYGAGFLVGGGVTALSTLAFFLLCREKALIEQNHLL